ncbi:MAG TPA: hypothetical protein VF510_24090 [Ktedonobacterales bacterium]
MNTVATIAKITTSYKCLFCGVRYDDVAEMHNCSICGHSVASGWLVKQSHSHAERYLVPEGQQIYRAA